MAIAFDNSAAYSVSNPVISQTRSYLVGSNADRLLIVHILGDVAATSGISEVTYNGDALTKFATIRVGSDRAHDVWYRTGPVSGTNDVIITRGSSGLIISGFVSYDGVDQTTGLTTATTGTDNTSDLTWDGGSITTTASGSWVGIYIRETAGQTMTEDAGWLERRAGNGMHLGDSDGSVSVGSNSYSGSWSGSVQDSYILAEILEAGGGGPTFTPKVMWFS